MIETKEQYELFKSWMSVRGTATDATDVSTQDAVETIEALREVARVAENALNYNNERGTWTLSDDEAPDMQEAYARIPDWLTDDA